jgi:hypothetical protein
LPASESVCIAPYPEGITDGSAGADVQAMYRSVETVLAVAKAARNNLLKKINLKVRDQKGRKGRRGCESWCVY